MQSPEGFARVSDTKLERPQPHIRVEHYRQQVKARFASALKPAEQARGWQILLIPEGVILAWEQQPANLRWLGNVGAVFDGHRKYYGVYVGDANIFYSTLGGFKPKAGRPTGSGKGYQRKYLFRLEQQLREAAERVVPLPKQRGMRSAWLRLFILKGAEALGQGKPEPEGEAQGSTRGSDRGKVEGLRVTSEEEAQIEPWREGRSDSALMRRLFAVGVVHLRTVDQDAGDIWVDG